MRRGCGEARHCPRPYPALAPKPPIMQPVYAGRPRNLRLRRSEKTPFCEGRGARKPCVSSTSVPRRSCSRPLSGGMGLGAGRFDAVPRPPSGCCSVQACLGAGRFDAVPRPPSGCCSVQACLGAGRSDTVPRLARQIPHAKISLGAGRSATVLRHRKDSVDIMARFGTGRFVTAPQRHELISRLRSMPKSHRPPSASSMVGMRRSRSRTSRTLDAPLALPLLRCRFVTVGPDLGRNA